MDNIQQEYTLQEQNNIFYLKTNGNPMICPFRNPIMIPGKLQGQITYQYLGCSSLCPKFSIHENSVKTNCGSTTVVKIDHVTYEKETPIIKI